MWIALFYHILNKSDPCAQNGKHDNGYNQNDWIRLFLFQQPEQQQGNTHWQKVREDSIEELSLYRNLDTTVYLNDRQQVNRNIGSNQRTDYRDTQNCCGIGNHIRVLCDDINGTCSKGVAKTGPDNTQNPDNHIGRKENNRSQNGSL